MMLAALRRMATRDSQGVRRQALFWALAERMARSTSLAVAAVKRPSTKEESMGEVSSIRGSAVFTGLWSM